MRPMSPTELDVQREQFHRELMRKEMRIAELEMIVLQTRARYEQLAELEADAAAAARRPPAQAHAGLDARLMRERLPRLG